MGSGKSEDFSDVRGACRLNPCSLSCSGAGPMLCPRTPKCFVPPLILIPIRIFFFFPEELSTVDTVCSFARSARSGVAL